MDKLNCNFRVFESCLRFLVVMDRSNNPWTTPSTSHRNAKPRTFLALLLTDPLELNRPQNLQWLGKIHRKIPWLSPTKCLWKRPQPKSRPLLPKGLSLEILNWVKNGQILLTAKPRLILQIQIYRTSLRMKIWFHQMKKWYSIQLSEHQPKLENWQLILMKFITVMLNAMEVATKMTWQKKLLRFLKNENGAIEVSFQTRVIDNLESWRWTLNVCLSCELNANQIPGPLESTRVKKGENTGGIFNVQVDFSP